MSIQIYRRHLSGAQFASDLIQLIAEVISSVDSRPDETVLLVVSSAHTTQEELYINAEYESDRGAEFGVNIIVVPQP